MSKKYMKRGLLSAALAVGTLGSGSVFAVKPVFDAMNYSANAVTAGSTAWTAAHTTWIFWSLNKNQKGSMLYSTKKIDKSTQNIDNSTKSIEKYTSLNYDINKEFNYITNNYYGSDPVIIPTGVDEDFGKMLDRDNVKGYVNNYKDANAYKDGVANSQNLTEVGVMGTVMQKTANDALVNTLSSQRDSIRQQAADLERLAKDSVSPEAQGHGKQLQYANALAGAQAAQMIEIRGMMLASENARAAAAQADADRKSRQVASSQSLRAGLAGGEGALKVSGTGLGNGATADGKTFN